MSCRIYVHYFLLTLNIESCALHVGYFGIPEVVRDRSRKERLQRWRERDNSTKVCRLDAMLSLPDCRQRLGNNITDTGRDDLLKQREARQHDRLLKFSIDHI